MSQGLIALRAIAVAPAIARSRAIVLVVLSIAARDEHRQRRVILDMVEPLQSDVGGLAVDVGRATTEPHVIAIDRAHFDAETGDARPVWHAGMHLRAGE